jgi:large subunit ribosomal protein L25
MKVEMRTEKVKQLRQKGIVPGVVYAKGFENVNVQTSQLEFSKALRGYGTSKTFSINLGKEKHIVYIKDYQQDYMDNSVFLHFDLVKVSSDDTLTAYVNLHFIGKEKFLKSTKVLTTNLDEVEIEYNVGSGVSHIDVDVTELTEEQPILVKDLVLPKGIKVLNDPNEIVCNLQEVQIYEEKEESDEQEGYVTPTVEESEEE